MANTTDQELLHYVTQLNEAEKKSVLQLIKTFSNGRAEVSERISIEQYNKELAEAEAEYERGQYISHDEMLKQMKEW